MAAPTNVRGLCAAVVAATDASACVVSRVLGDVLVQIAEHVNGEGTLLTGQGYLASDFPLTVEVLQRLEPRRVWVGDPDGDQAEVALLRQLGYDALLMLPLVVEGEAWGLVEAYRNEPFDAGHEAAGRAVLDAAV